MCKVRYDLMRPSEILAARERVPLAYLVFGPLEWHGPHLPLGTDPLIAQEVALRVARRVGGVVLPPYFCGTERERDEATLRDLGLNQHSWVVGMDFPGNSLPSTYLPEEVLAVLARSLLEQLIRQKYRLVAIINGHGATNQIQTLERLAAEFSHEHGIRVRHFFVSIPDEHGVTDFGHASSGETARMMRLYPETVDLGTLPPPDEDLVYRDWAIVDSEAFAGAPDPEGRVRDDPRTQASAEKGEQLLERTADYIAHRLRQSLQDPNISTRSGQ